MKKYIILFLIIFISCGGSYETANVEDTSTTSSITTISTTTTTLAIEEVPVLNIEITNCPIDIVDIEIGESFKIEFFVQAGSSDVTSIFYYFELNGEYYSRLPLDKENHSDYFDFPTWHNITESATFVEKQADGDVYYIYIDVFDDELNSVSTECEVKF